MAGIYSIAGSTFVFNPATSTPILEIAPLSVARPKIIEITLDINPGVTGFDVGIGHSTAGVAQNPATQQQVIAEDGGPNSVVFVTTSWNTYPALPAAWWRRYVNPQSAGLYSLIQWEFPRGLAVTSTNSVSIWIVGGAASASPTLFDYNIVLEC